VVSNLSRGGASYTRVATTTWQRVQALSIAKATAPVLMRASHYDLANTDVVAMDQPSLLIGGGEAIFGHRAEATCPYYAPSLLGHTLGK
jgi:hypothetical protein